MLFRQLFDQTSWTFSYLLADEVSGEAVLIDSVKEQAPRDLQLLRELGLSLKYALDTHVHADHVTGLSALKDATGCQTGVSVHGGTCADLQLKEGDRLHFGQYELHVLETPGHTDGCLSFVCEDKVFTGDALMIRACGRTDFQQGDAGRLYDSITGKLFTLPEHTQVYPGHDYKGMTMTTIAEEKKLNPRLSKSRDAFVELMQHLKLAPPKRIDVAVPANLRCGRDAA